MTGYICAGCGKSYERLQDTIDCSNSHEPIEHVLEDSVSLEDAAPKTYPPKAPELLGRAAMHMHERGKTYDEPEGERSMGKTVTAFNAITGRDLSESEGWLFMATLKEVRGFTRSEWHQDSFEDLIAYAALMAEARGAGR